MGNRKLKILNDLKNKGLISFKDSDNTFDKLLKLAIEENEDRMENSKKNIDDILDSYDIISHSFLNRLETKLLQV